MPNSQKALGILELSSIAKGYQCLNTVASEDGIELIEGSFVSPGKFVILFQGQIAHVERALGKVISPYRPWLVDSALIKAFRPELIKGLYGLLKVEVGDDLLVIETSTLSSAMKAAQLAVVSCTLQIIEIRSGRGIGGKSVVFLTGSTESVMAGLAEIQLQFRGGEFLIGCEAISGLTPQFRRYFSMS